MVREGNNFLQVCKQIGALTKVSNPEGDVTIMREAMGVLQVNLAINVVHIFQSEWAHLYGAIFPRMKLG